jgi:hypothetical protein
VLAPGKDGKSVRILEHIGRLLPVWCGQVDGMQLAGQARSGPRFKGAWDCAAQVGMRSGAGKMRPLKPSRQPDARAGVSGGGPAQPFCGVGGDPDQRRTGVSKDGSPLSRS